MLLTVLLIPLLTSGGGQLFLGAIVAGLGAVWIIQKPQWGTWMLLVLFFSGLSPTARGNPYLRRPDLISARLLVPQLFVAVQHRQVWV
ncbi:MAG: hypothetical protein ACREQ3_15025, partial [Candidatus Binatia bacterium]